MASKTTEARLKLRQARQSMQWAIDADLSASLHEQHLWDTIKSLVDATDLLSQALADTIVGEADEA